MFATPTPKRRLIYVPEETVDFLFEGSAPPPRATRFSRSQVRSSVEPQPQLSEEPGAAPLLVSYKGFLLLNDSGEFEEPENIERAVELHNELRRCIHFLRSYVNENAPGTLSSGEREQSDEELEMPVSHSKSYTEWRGQKSRCRLRRVMKLSVEQLRAELRNAGLPTTGVKTVLQNRLRKYYRKPKDCPDEEEEAAASTPLPSVEEETQEFPHTAPAVPTRLLLDESVSRDATPRASHGCRISHHSDASRASTTLFSNRSSVGFPLAEQDTSGRDSLVVQEALLETAEVLPLCSASRDSLSSHRTASASRRGTQGSEAASRRGTRGSEPTLENTAPEVEEPASVSRSIWGTLVTAGSKLFMPALRGTPGRSSDRKRERDSSE